MSPCRLLLRQYHLSLCRHLYTLPQRLLQLLNAFRLLPQRLLLGKNYSSEKCKTYNCIQNWSLIAFTVIRTKLFWIQSLKLMIVFSSPHLLWAIISTAAFASCLPKFPRQLLALLLDLPGRG